MTSMFSFFPLPFALSLPFSLYSTTPHNKKRMTIYSSGSGHRRLGFPFFSPPPPFSPALSPHCVRRSMAEVEKSIDSDRFFLFDLPPFSAPSWITRWGEEEADFPKSFFSLSPIPKIIEERSQSANFLLFFFSYSSLFGVPSVTSAGRRRRGRTGQTSFSFFSPIPPSREETLSGHGLSFFPFFLPLFFSSYGRTGRSEMGGRRSERAVPLFSPLFFFFPYLARQALVMIGFKLYDALRSTQLVPLFSSLVILFLCSRDFSPIVRN